MATAALGTMTTMAGVSACSSSDDGGSTPGAVTTTGEGGPSTNEDGSVTTQPGNDGGGTDSASDSQPSGPRDPFAAQSRATKDFPVAGDYVVDLAKGTVTDKTTGLLWSRAALAESQLPPDGGDGSPSTQAEARTQCETATIGGTKGWRLPTRIELLSIISLDDAHVHDTTAFDGPTFENLPLLAATDDTTRNAYYEGHYHPHTYYANLAANWFSGQVHCVKAPYPVTANATPPPADRFSPAPNSVLVDSVTHLEWFTKPKLAALQYPEATAFCEGLSAGDAGAPVGGKPWRVPSLKEATSLWLESAKGFPAVFGLTNNFYFWTSGHYVPPPPLVGSPGYFRLVLDNTRASGDFYWEVADFASAICVRDGA